MAFRNHFKDNSLQQFALLLTKCHRVSYRFPRGDLMSDRIPLGGHP
jgi:hypothetical protein